MGGDAVGANSAFSAWTLASKTTTWHSTWKRSRIVCEKNDSVVIYVSQLFNRHLFPLNNDAFSGFNILSTDIQIIIRLIITHL